MKRLIIISTGRCGTKRISELLEHALLESEIIVSHQGLTSRIANLAGNLMYYLGEVEMVKSLLFRSQKLHTNQRIISDPLISMCIPKKVIDDKDTFILHLTRDCHSFSKSMFDLSRKRAYSFIAHNLIPFWQIDLWPLENLLSRDVRKKYALVCERKNRWFEKQYGDSPNYTKVSMSEVFEDSFLINLVEQVFGKTIELSKEQLNTKSNQSQ